jgi:hypothetical protein
VDELVRAGFMEFAVEPRAGWEAELEDLGAVAASVWIRASRDSSLTTQ